MSTYTANDIATMEARLLGLSIARDAACAERDGARKERDAARAEGRELVWVLEHNGFRRCDIAACNCGSWHAGPNLRADKAEEERDEAREEATEMRHQAAANLDVAEKARDVAKDIAKQRDEARAELAESRVQVEHWQRARQSALEAGEVVVKQREELRAELAQAKQEREMLRKAMGRISAVEVRVGDGLSAPGRFLIACRNLARAALDGTKEKP